MIKKIESNSHLRRTNTTHDQLRHWRYIRIVDCGLSLDPFVEKKRKIVLVIIDFYEVYILTRLIKNWKKHIANSITIASLFSVIFWDNECLNFSYFFTIGN